MIATNSAGRGIRLQVIRAETVLWRPDIASMMTTPTAMAPPMTAAAAVAVTALYKHD